MAPIGARSPGLNSNQARDAVRRRAVPKPDRLPDVAVVADAGTVSAANPKAIEDGPVDVLLGARIPDVPYVVAQWRRHRPGASYPRWAHLRPTLAGPADRRRRRDQVIYYHYPAERARRTLRHIDEQVATAEKAVTGQTAVKRNRFVRLRRHRKVNRTPEAKA